MSRTPESETAIGVAMACLAEADPDRLAVSCGTEHRTRAEFESRTNRLARAYRELGVVPDSLVTIALPNGIEFLEATVATWKAGATPQPLAGKAPAAERDAIIELARPSLVVGVTSAATSCPHVPAGFVADARLADGPLEPTVARALKAPTSGGSTGRPKLIVSGQAATTEVLALYARLTGMTDDGVHLATGPLYHNGPFLFAVAALVTGNHIVVMERFDALESLQLVERHHVDWMYSVPTMMNRTWRLTDEQRLRPDLSSLRVVFHMAAACPPWLKAAWIDWLGPEKILELYGGTEGQVATFLDGVEWLQHRGSVGRPVMGQLAVLDEAGGPLPAGEVGTIWMRPHDPGSPTYRYIGATARSREDGWETLGDMGWLDEDGYLFLTDRDTDMFVVGGSNVYPAEIEGALLAHPSVIDACVIGVPHVDLGHVPHAIVQASPGVTADELRRHLGEMVASYKQPRTFDFVDHPLRDDAGKVRRSDLRASHPSTG